MEEKKLVFYSKGLGIFRGLGMTTQQAKVYLTLSKLGQATVTTIATAAQMDRAEVYRVIPKLQKRGLVKKIITSPISFKAVPLSEGLKISLLENAEKHDELCRQAEQLLRNFNYNREESSQEYAQYELTSGLKAEEREFLGELKELQNSKDGIFDWKFVLFGVNRYFQENKAALERGVKIRNITHIPKGERMPENILTLMKAGSFEIKSTPTIPKASIDILDKKRVHIIIFPNSNIEEIEVLRSNNPATVELVQDYFDMKWQAATIPCWHKKTIK
jgi:sugar-specific transcriptional regulator TrmB